MVYHFHQLRFLLLFPREGIQHNVSLNFIFNTRSINHKIKYNLNYSSVNNISFNLNLRKELCQMLRLDLIFFPKNY